MTSTINPGIPVAGTPAHAGAPLRGNFTAAYNDINALQARVTDTESVTATGSTTSRTLEDRFADIVNVKDYGAQGDGFSNDSGPFLAASNAVNGTRGFVLIPGGTYTGITTAAVPYGKDIVWLNNSGITNFFDLPGIQFGPVAERLQVSRMHSSPDTGDFATFAQFRNADHVGGVSLNHGIYSSTNVQASVTSSEWALTGVIHAYNTTGAGHVAVSGVANKHEGSTPQIWGGHFQANDDNIYALPNDVGSLTGIEVNMQAIGLDRTITPYGMRHVLAVISRTNEVPGWDTAPGNSGDAEIGAGVLVRTDDVTNGYFRYGVAVYEQSGNPNPITTAILINSTGTHGLQVQGDHTTAAIRLDGNDAVGLMCQGIYTTGNAIRIAEGQAISLEASGQIRFWYDSAVTAVKFGTGTTERIGLDIGGGGTSGVRVLGTKVIGARSTGWAAQTAVASKADLGAAPTVNQLASYISALNAALITHGLIGA